LEEFMKTNNEQLVTKAVEMYKTEMLPKLKDIQQLRYDINWVEFDLASGQFFLTQRKNSMESLEFGPASEDNVKSFIKSGSLPVKEKKGKTLKKAGQEGKLKTKTRKLKPKIIVQEEEEEEREEEV